MLAKFVVELTYCLVRRCLSYHAELRSIRIDNELTDDVPLSREIAMEFVDDLERIRDGVGDGNLPDQSLVELGPSFRKLQHALAAEIDPQDEWVSEDEVQLLREFELMSGLIAAISDLNQVNA